MDEHYEEIVTDRDRLSIKYELLKIDYEKIKNDLKEKEKIINEYKICMDATLNEPKKIDEQIYLFFCSFKGVKK